MDNSKDNNGITRLTEIIQLVDKLKWVSPIPKEYNLKFSYPLMQLSEVEKCMTAMFDDNQLQRMRDWVKQDELRKKIAVMQEQPNDK